ALSVKSPLFNPSSIMIPARFCFASRGDRRLSPTVQATLDTGRAFRRLRPVSAAFLALLATACAGGVDIDRLAADRTITTGSVETAYAGRPADGVASDEETIRNALGSADLAQLG